MNQFSLPFTIKCPENNDFVIAKCYETKKECYKLTITKGKHLLEPIRICFKASHAPLRLSLGIELLEGSAATIIEEWDAGITASEIDFTSHITCQSGAMLNYIVLNGSSNKTKLRETRNSDVAAGAGCHIYTYHFGTKKLESKMIQNASGKGAQINTDIIARSADHQDLSFDCTHRFAEKEGAGEIIMKGIAQESALLSFDGMVNIEQSGGGSAGYLKQETLNLSPSTTVRAVPALKIDTNDVKAGHSAAIRNLNDEDVFYFGARGIDKEMAKKLLITGFLEKELKKIEHHKSAYETVRKLI